MFRKVLRENKIDSGKIEGISWTAHPTGRVVRMAAALLVLLLCVDTAYAQTTIHSSFI